MFGAKLVFYLVLGMALVVGSGYYVNEGIEARRDVALRQFEDNDQVAKQVRMEHWGRTTFVGGLGAAYAFLGVLLFASDAVRAMNRSERPSPRSGTPAY